jgi:hypothetical protein
MAYHFLHVLDKVIEVLKYDSPSVWFLLLLLIIPFKATDKMAFLVYIL